MSTSQEIRHARAFKAAQAYYENIAEPEDDDAVMTEAEARGYAEEQVMSTGYQLARAIKSICIDALGGAVSFDALHGLEWTPDCSMQELLAVAISGREENSRIAILELRDRILACAQIQEQIKERAAEIIREQEREAESARDAFESDKWEARNDK